MTEAVTGAEAQPLLDVRELSVRFPVASGFFGRSTREVFAVDEVSFTIGRGETLGLVGESGSGKTTTGRAVLRRLPVTSGEIHFRGQDITAVKGKELRGLRQHMQLVFQDPYASLNPRMSVQDIIAEPLIVHGRARSTREALPRVHELLRLTGLPEDAAGRYPQAFSGGQRQRIGIARALVIDPELIIADEPVSALDVSIQAQVVNLLQDLQQELGLSYLFIAHDLSVVRHISDRIAIMYAGRIVETASSDAIYEAPRHPYTKALLSAVPIPDPDVAAQRTRIVLSGEMPDVVDPPASCRFATRCPYRQPERCDTETPPLRAVDGGQWVACHYAEDIDAGRIRPSYEPTPAAP
ncbi:MAG TPA: oligopeptide/dipeptide ABC transporter ATP-binding protein [Acidimicrobiales bacterium]|nr:oligopeptide/dipeptide ABC transporter ATP-binding protein [Acidimicrobiales bacterium]